MLTNTQTLLVVTTQPQIKQSAKLYSSHRNWDSLTPHPQASVSPTFGSGGGGTLAGERRGESLSSDEETYTVVLFVYMYFVV